MTPRTHRAAFIQKYVNLSVLAGVDGATPEPIQEHLWNTPDSTVYSALVKGRQQGYSTATALEGLVRATMYPNSTVVFTSYCQRDSRNRRRSVNRAYDAIWPRKRPTFTKDTAEEILLSNGSLMAFTPSTPPRGYERATYYWDEMPSCRDELQIFQAIMAGVIRDGRVRIGSTPLGTSNRFAQLFLDREANSKWEVSSWPWWTCRSFIRGDFDEVQELAPTMPTEERLQRFASERLLEVRESYGIDEELFTIEMECDFIEGVDRWLPMDLIMRCEVDPEPTPEPEGSYYVGFDIARSAKGDQTALVKLQKVGDELRLVEWQTMRGVPFAKQREAVLSFARDAAKMAGDASGLGWNLVEDVQEAVGSSKCEAVKYTQESKEQLMSGLKTAMELAQLKIPVSRELRNDLHGIKYTRTPMGHMKFTAERGAHGHCDGAQAIALAVRCAPSKEKPPINWHLAGSCGGAPANPWRGA